LLLHRPANACTFGVTDYSFPVEHLQSLNGIAALVV
jgi:hypothetical protein